MKWEASARAGAGFLLRSASDGGPLGPASSTPTVVVPEVTGDFHLALMPLVRAGLYATAGYSTGGAAGDLFALGGGTRAKITPPLGWTTWKAWLFLGFGYGRYAWHGADALSPNSDGQSSVVHQTLELPVGLGLSRKLGRGIDLRSEAGFRWALASFRDAAVDPSRFHRPTGTVEVSIGIGYDP